MNANLLAAITTKKTSTNFARKTLTGKTDERVESAAESQELAELCYCESDLCNEGSKDVMSWIIFCGAVFVCFGTVHSLYVKFEFHLREQNHVNLFIFSCSNNN